MTTTTIEETADLETKVKTTVEEEESRLTGKALLAKIKDLSQLSKRETAIECGYTKLSKAGTERADVTAFYDAILVAKGVEVKAAATAAPGRVPNNELTVHKNGQVLIGPFYTKKMGLKEGDTIKIKLGSKNIQLTIVD